MKIIAEVGSNWSTFEDCKNSIAQAKLCGADAVKFQLFTSQALYGLSIEQWYQVDSDQYLGRSMPGQLPPEWLPGLAEKAKACGIEFMCTAFSPELIDVVDPYVQTHKVASSDLTHIRMLQKLRQIGKPVILSTGASHMGDIQAAVNLLTADWGQDLPPPWGNILGPPVTLMYCVSAYPARYIDFRNLDFLRKEFGNRCQYGYSDHSIDIACIPVEAMKHGATVIEKHVNFVDAKGPDSPHSLDTHEFKLMVQAIRGGCIYVSHEQHDMFVKHNRRLIATRDISPGEKLVENENFGIYRSLKPDSKALSPWGIDQVNGQIAKIAIKCGEGISPDCF